MAIWLLEKSKFGSAFSIAGYVDDNIGKHGYLIDGYPVLGTTWDLPDIIENKNISLILYAISNIKPGEKERILKQCEQTTVRLVIIPDLLDLIQSQFIPNAKRSEETTI